MKALFVGLGSIGQRHLRNLRELKGESVNILAWRVRGLDRVLTNTLEVELGGSPVPLWLASRADAGSWPVGETRCYLRLQSVEPTCSCRTGGARCGKPRLCGKTFVK